MLWILHIIIRTAVFHKAENDRAPTVFVRQSTRTQLSKTKRTHVLWPQIAFCTRLGSQFAEHFCRNVLNAKCVAQNALKMSRVQRNVLQKFRVRPVREREQLFAIFFEKN